MAHGKGIQKYEFDMYLDIHRLLHNKKDQIKHKFVKKWKSFKDLLNFAERIEDVSLINKIKVCQKYRDLPDLIEKIKSMHSSDMSLADIVFSTAHKSKGLEFDTVQLTDDYSVYENEEDHHSWSDSDDDLGSLTPPRPPDLEEGNILYVAITRAKKSLILNNALTRVLRDAKEHFLYPTVQYSELSEGVCNLCGWHNHFPALHIQSPSGLVCTQCSSAKLPFLHTDPTPIPAHS
jgi:F-box protein 18 (helicase)